MTTFTAAPVSNFVMPAAGNANFIRLVFQASDNDQPFGFLGKPGLPQDYVPQGLIIDTRGISTALEVQVTVGGVLPFEITAPAGTYASYIVPAFANPVITVAGLQAADELVIYTANFPLFPQQYGNPNVSINLSSPGPIGNTTPNTGAFTDLKTDTLEVSGSATVPNATAGTQEPVPIVQADARYQPAGNYAASGANSDITSLTGLTTPLAISEGGTGATTAAQAITNLGAQPAGSYAALNGNSNEGFNASIFSCNGGNTYLSSNVASYPGLNLSPNYFINASTTINYYSNSKGHVFDYGLSANNSSVGNGFRATNSNGNYVVLFNDGNGHLESYGAQLWINQDSAQQITLGAPGSTIIASGTLSGNVVASQIPSTAGGVGTYAWLEISSGSSDFGGQIAGSSLYYVNQVGSDVAQSGTWVNMTGFVNSGAALYLRIA